MFPTYSGPPEPGTENPVVKWYNEVGCSSTATNNHTTYGDQILMSSVRACNADANVDPDCWPSDNDESGYRYASSGGADTLLSAVSGDGRLLQVVKTRMSDTATQLARPTTSAVHIRHSGSDTNARLKEEK